MKARVSEQQSIFSRTGKPVKGTLSTSVRNHLLICDHQVASEDFRIFGNECNKSILE